MDNTTTPSTEKLDNLAPTEPTTTPPIDPAPSFNEPVSEPDVSETPNEASETSSETPDAPEEAPVTPQPVVASHGPKKSGLKTVLVTLLVLLLAAATAGAVYMWQQNKVDDLNAQLTNAKAASSTKAAAAATTTKSADPNLAKATTLVKDFYTEYNKNVEDGSADVQTIISKYGNANLAFYNKYYNFGYDPIICGQDALPDTYTVAGSKTADGVATVLVKTSATTSIDVRVVDQGGLKVDGITCPGDLGKAKPHDAES